MLDLGELRAEEARSELGRDPGLAGRDEAMDAEAARSVEQAVVPKLREDLVSGCFGARHQHYSLPHDVLDDPGQQRVMRAAQQNRVDILVLQALKVSPGRLDDFVGRCITLLDEINERRA